MAEPHVIGALRNKRAELDGMLRQLEQQLAQQRTNLAHVDATMRLFDPDLRRPRSAIIRRWRSRCVGAVSAEELATAPARGGMMTAASG
jgi:hypothetical protein